MEFLVNFNRLALFCVFRIVVSGFVKKEKTWFAGAHLNPALSVAIAVVGRLKWRKLIVYLVAQYLGGFCASAGILLIYRGELNVS